MKRRVIQIAGSTQLVSLPRKWAIKQGIQKGDEIDVVEDGDKIVISTNKVLEVKKVQLDVKKIDNLLIRMLSAYYKAGYDEVELRFNGTFPTERIADELKKHMPGFEILDQTKSHCLIKSISEEHVVEFEASLRRVFLITITMAKNMLETLKNPKENDPKQFLVLEQTNNRFTNFCERLLNKHGLDSYKNSNLIYTIVWELEKVADELKYMALFLVLKMRLMQHRLAMQQRRQQLMLILAHLWCLAV